MYNRTLWGVTLALVIVVLMLLAFPFSVLAISVPDSGPFILNVDIYRHVLESDDILVHGQYNWPYSVGPPDTAPAETVTQSVFVRLMNGATEVAGSTIYSYYRRGWGYGSFSMYLDAASAVGLWGTGLTVEVRGSPTLSWTGGTNYVVTTNVLNWNATANGSATRVMMYSHIISWASTLGDYWNLALVVGYADGDRFSSYGEAYFPNAISGLRVLVPQLFSGSVETPQYTDITYPTTGADAYKSAWPFNFGGISEYFGMPSDDEVFRTLIAFLIIFVVCAVMVRYGAPPPFALFAGFGLLFVLAIPGFISTVIVGGAMFLIVLLTGMVFILRRN